MTAFTDAHREVRGRTDLQGEADPPSTSRMCRANPPDLRPQGARHDEVPCTRIRRVSDENEQAYSAQGLARSVASVRRVGSPPALVRQVWDCSGNGPGGLAPRWPSGFGHVQKKFARIVVLPCGLPRG